MPPGLHGELARAAEREKRSLNAYIIASLTESVGWAKDGDAHREGRRSRDGRVVTWLLVANVVAVSLAGLAAVVILLVAAL